MDTTGKNGSHNHWKGLHTSWYKMLKYKMEELGKKTLTIISKIKSDWEQSNCAYNLSIQMSAHSHTPASLMFQPHLRTNMHSNFTRKQNTLQQTNTFPDSQSKQEWDPTTLPPSWEQEPNVCGIPQERFEKIVKKDFPPRHLRFHPSLTS